MSLRTCVVSLATDAKQYPQALDRLCASLVRVRFAGEVVCWRPGQYPAGAPSHRNVPFAFKPYCFQEAKRQGMALVLWLDSACVVTRPLDPFFQLIRDQGYLLFRNGRYVVGEWASDEALGFLSMTREVAMGLPEINAAAIGLNMNDPVAMEFLQRWQVAAAQEVPFRGVTRPLRNADDYLTVKWNRNGHASADPRVRGHRHDQTVAGILAHRLGMQLTLGGIQPYSRRLRGISRQTAIVVDRDIAASAGELVSLRRVIRDVKIGRIMQALNRLGFSR